MTFPLPKRTPKPDYLGVDPVDPVFGDMGAAALVADAQIKEAMRTEPTPIADAVERDQRAATDGQPVGAGESVTCAECGRSVKARYDGLPVRHKYPTKSKGWCPGR